MRLAVVGLGRIGQYHANHAQEVAKETGESDEGNMWKGILGNAAAARAFAKFSDE